MFELLESREIISSFLRTVKGVLVSDVLQDYLLNILPSSHDSNIIYETYLRPYLGLDCVTTQVMG